MRFSSLYANLTRAFKEPLLKHSQKVSVVVCTSGRCSDLDRCLCSLCCQDYFNYEIIVIDTAPANGRARQLVDCFEGIRYVPQYRKGRRFVRQCAAATASGDILAYVKDSWVAGPQWVSGIAARTETERRRSAPAYGHVAAGLPAVPGRPDPGRQDQPAGLCRLLRKLAADLKSTCG